MSLSKIFDQAHTDTESRMDLVPILDMMITLLIFFVVAASLGQQHAMQIQSAKAGNAPSVKDQHFVLFVDSLGHMRYEGKEISDQEAVNAARTWMGKHPGGMVVVQPDGRGRVDALVLMLDELKGAGIQNISLGVSAKKNTHANP